MTQAADAATGSGDPTGAMTGYELIAATLAAAGVKVVFALMGDANLKLLMCLQDAYAIPHIGVHHESTAVSMADGYARATGGLAVAVVTRGPAVTNTLTAAVSSTKAGSAVLVLAGDTSTNRADVRGLAHLQDIDQQRVFQGAGIREVSLTAATLPTALRAAVATARGLSCPVAVNMPIDVQETAGYPPPVAAPRPEPAPPLAPDPGVLDRACDALRGARRPLILAGKGAVRAGAIPALAGLGERVGALLATSLAAKDAFAGDPWSVGVAGGFASPLAETLIGQADVVLAMGASLNDHTTKATTLFAADAQLIHCDVEPMHVDRWQRATQRVIGDAGVVAARLHEALADHDSQGWRSEEVRRAIADHDWRDEYTEIVIDGYVDPRLLSVELDRMLPWPRALAVDAGHHCGYSAGHIGVPGPDHFLSALDFSSVGLGLGTALGAAVARPNCCTVLGIGDGGLLMNLGDLNTVGRLGLPMVIVVYNDGAFGAEVHMLRDLGMSDAPARFPTPDFADVARSMGLEGFVIRSLDDLRAIEGRLGRVAGPVLLDCRVHPHVRAHWSQEQSRIRALAAAQKRA